VPALAVVADLTLAGDGGGRARGRGAQLAAVVVLVVVVAELAVVAVPACSRRPASPGRRGGGAGR
jgi:hypothetical protein